MNRPIFFIGGAQRSGTTYLYTILKQHPEICMTEPSKPEPKFFLDHHEVAKGKGYYLKKFYSDSPETRIYGEKSTSYIESESAGKRIKEMFPDAKIIFILRNPITRAISNYFFSVANGLEKRTIHEVFVEKKPIHGAFSTSVSPFKYLERGEYKHYLETYFSIFGMNNVKVLLFEDMIESEDFVEDTFRFLGINNSFRPSTLNEKVNANEETFEVDGAVTDILNQYFRQHNKDLEKLLGVSLAKWKV